MLPEYFFVDGNELLQGMKLEHVCFVVIPKDGKEEVEEVPTEVANLLGEFLDIVLDNLPNELPLVRKINH